jgi:DDE superfamily endonuclease
MFGTLHLRSGHLLLMERTRQRGLEFQEFLDFIRWHYRTDSVALLLDEHSTHTDEESQSLADDLDIRLLWLPNRSPQLNPMDHLWGFGKSEVCANRQQSSIEAQVDWFRHYYEMLSPTEVLRKSGMLSQNFWLYKVGHF